MGTFDPNSMPPAPVSNPEPEAPANPWAPWEQAGIRPDAFAPDEVRNGAQLWKALSNRDYRDPARAQLLRGDILEDGETMEDLREAMRLRRESANDPWANMQEEPEVYYDPRTGQPLQTQQPEFDPRMLQSAVQQTVQQQLAEFQRQQAEQRQQESLQNEFMTELNRRREKHSWDDYETQAALSYAAQARSANPYASVGELFNMAEKAHDDMITRRLASVSERQMSTAPRTATPSGPAPAEGEPKSLAEAEALMARDMGR